MNMSLCKYYANGNCRYGDRCRFSHSSAPRYPHPQHRPQFNPRFSFVAAAAANPSNPGAFNARPRSHAPKLFTDAINWARTNFTDSEYALDILQVLQKEARQWLKSGALWRFTSRRIFPGGHPFPDWIDYSFEEVRWEFYMKKAQNQEHLYKKAYSDYWEATERQLIGLSQLRVETLNIFKPYIEECIQRQYHPTKTPSTDVDMESSVVTVSTNGFMGNATPVVPTGQVQSSSVHYSADDSLLEEERLAYESDSFEFGRIPLQPPPRNFS